MISKSQLEKCLKASKYLGEAEQEELSDKLWVLITDDKDDQRQKEKSDAELVTLFICDYTGVSDFNISEFNLEFKDLAERMIDKGWSK